MVLFYYRGRHLALCLYSDSEISLKFYSYKIHHRENIIVQHVAVSEIKTALCLY